MVGVVFVHGCWMSPSGWDDVRNILATRKITSYACCNPSSGTYDSSATLADMHADAINLHNTLASIAGPVVVVGHSYGGVIITEGAAGASNVKHLVYLAALMPQPGQSVMDILGTLPDWLQVNTEKNYCVPMGSRTTDIFYNDYTQAQMDRYVPQIKIQSLSSISQPVSAFAYKEKPCTYVLTKRDHAVPPEAQKHMSTAAAVAYTVELDAGHCPFVSKAKTLADIIEGIVKDVTSHEKQP